MITVIYGTRPEAIKLAPVVVALRARNAVVNVLCTGQHQELKENILENDEDLNLMSKEQSLSDFLARAITKIDAYFNGACPKIVVTQGDTLSAFAGTLVAFHRNIKSAHVEAGLRTYDLNKPFPEEGYRQMIDRIATRLYAPTSVSYSGLVLHEKRSSEDVVFTRGNTGVDAALHSVNHCNGTSVGVPPFILVTLHRRESFGVPIESVCQALKRIAQRGLQVVVPVHPNPNAGDPIRSILGKEPNVKLVAPLKYHDLIRTMLDAVCVVTDSGGIQEEAPALGVPVIVTRETTERSEGIAAGAAVLVGFDEDRIVTEVLRLYIDPSARAKMAVSRDIYGDGKAGERIADDLIQWGNT